MIDNPITKDAEDEIITCVKCGEPADEDCYNVYGAPLCGACYYEDDFYDDEGVLI